MLRITEIFHSMQGEAKTVGLPTAFVRLMERYSLVTLIVVMVMLHTAPVELFEPNQ